MKAPDFVGVGFPKCGTTFLYDECLMKHPEITRLPKERHFFSEPFKEFSEQDFKQYKRNFPVDGNLSGEFSPGILYYPLNIKFLSKAAPTAKLIVMVRNPIDRCFSHMKQMMSARKYNVRPGNEELFVKSSLYPEAIYSGLYMNGIERLEKYYDREQYIVIQYEKLLDEFSDEWERICEFLGIYVAGIPVNIKEPQQYHQFDHFRKHLADFYENDVDRLVQEFGDVLDMTLWEDFDA